MQYLYQIIKYYVLYHSKNWLKLYENILCNVIFSKNYICAALPIIVSKLFSGISKATSILCIFSDFIFPKIAFNNSAYFIERLESLLLLLGVF